MYKEMQLTMLPRSILLTCLCVVGFLKYTVFLAHTFTSLYLQKKHSVSSAVWNKSLYIYDTY